MAKVNTKEIRGLFKDYARQGKKLSSAMDMGGGGREARAQLEIKGKLASKFGIAIDDNDHAFRERSGRSASKVISRLERMQKVSADRAAIRAKLGYPSKPSNPPLKAGESFNPRTGEITRDKPNMPGDRLSKSGRTTVDKDGELVRVNRGSGHGLMPGKPVLPPLRSARRGMGGGGKGQPRVPAGNPAGGQFAKK